jgi:hypothetical protein
MEYLRVREERVRGAAGTPSCEIDVRLAGTKRKEVEAARIVVRHAVDDLGASLVPDLADQVVLEPVTGEDAEAPVALTVVLNVASRKAASIREVSGEIELYVPGADPASFVTIPDFRSRAGRPLALPALATNGIGITIQPAQPQAGSFAFGPEDVALKVSDPKKRIASFYLVDTEGTAWKTSREEREGLVVLSSQAEAPQPGWGLKVCLLTPNTLFRYRFILEGIPLP